MAYSQKGTIPWGVGGLGGGGGGGAENAERGRIKTLHKPYLHPIHSL